MWKTVIRSLVALLILLTVGRASAARKLFVREIVLKGTCVSEVSADSLRALIAQEVPREILQVRGLAYEDPTPYLDAGTWNAENFNARETRHIMQRLRQLDMQLMLWLEVSCVPGRPGEPTFVLAGRLVDLDRMDRILSCQDTQIRDQRRICHASGDVYEAVTFARVELHSFADLREKLRPLLARLLHIPELIVYDSTTTFAPGQKILLQFSMRRNDPAREASTGATAPARQRPFRYVQQVIRLPKEQRDAVCKDPEQHWDQLPCGGGDRGACRNPVRFDVSTLGTKPVPARQGEDGGPIISFRASSHEDDFLVRAEVVTPEEGGEVHSMPEYRCIKVRERNWRLGAAVRLSFGRPYDPYASPTSPLASYQWGPLLGVDLSIDGSVIRRRGLLPIVGLAAVLGGTYIAWNSNHGSRASSWATEVRGQVFFDVLHLGQGFLRFYVDAGLGIEWSSYELAAPAQHQKYGPDGVLMGGLGLSLGGHFGLSPGWALGVTFGILAQVRGHFTGWGFSDDQNHLPPMMVPLWFTLGIDLASPPR